jgi:hypothetical protein
VEESEVIAVLGDSPLAAISTDTVGDVIAGNSVIRSVVVASVVSCFVSVLSGHGKTTSETVESGEFVHVSTSTSSLTVKVVVDVVTSVIATNNCLLIFNGYGWVIHHLLASSCNSNNLTEVSTFLNEAVELFSDTFDYIAAFTEETTVISERSPIVDGSGLTS